MDKYYLAVDIGASSGRHMLARVKDGRVEMEEIYRFKNELAERHGHLCWDLDSLFREILAGLKACREAGKTPYSMGIDTWGVDFVLLDSQNRILGDTVAYRDSRTDGMDAAAEKLISPEELYARTGIQKQPFNTIYQLMAIQRQQPELLEQADCLLLLPSYFSFLLTGRKQNEYTNASTTGLLSAQGRDWDRELLRKINLPEKLFGPLAQPGDFLGGFTPAIAEAVGFDCRVILPATHDTGSAVLAVPMEGGEGVYISSGTWSLMGVESAAPNCSPASQRTNFTNEGGVGGTFRYLRNIMGLWIIQSVKRELKDAYSFNDLETLARENADFSALVDVNDHRFLAPASMTEAIRSYCRDTGQPVPEDIGQVMQCAYASLARCYAESIQELEALQGRTYESIRIVGGGCRDSYLNQLTAQATGKTVCAGPVEATALGNILAQLLADGAAADVEDVRALVRRSFPIETVPPTAYFSS